MDAPSALVVEVHADGGIRLTSPAGDAGLATAAATRDWVVEANRTGAPVHLRGAVGAPMAASVVEDVRGLADALDEEPSEATPWSKRRSSIQAAASAGLLDQVSDLLDRGASPTVGRGRTTPYRLAMQHGHVEVVAALLAAGVPRPRGLEPPAELADAVVLRAYPPRRLWWLQVPFVVIALLAGIDGAFAVVPFFVVLPFLAIGVVHLVLANTRCAFAGSLVARRRGRGWQGPVDLGELDALGHTPAGTIRSPVLWVLGQRTAGDRPNPYSTSAFDREQRAVLDHVDGLRYVPLFSGGGFLSPGFERLLVRHVDPATVVVGPTARERVWPARPPGDRRSGG